MSLNSMLIYLYYIFHNIFCTKSPGIKIRRRVLGNVRYLSLKCLGFKHILFSILTTEKWKRFEHLTFAHSALHSLIYARNLQETEILWNIGLLLPIHIVTALDIWAQRIYRISIVIWILDSHLTLSVSPYIHNKSNCYIYICRKLSKYLNKVLVYFLFGVANHLYLSIGCFISL